MTCAAKHTILNVQSELCEERCLVLKTRIAELRRQRRISQVELADAVGVTRQTITSIECEKYVASLPIAYRIAKFFNLSIEEVFDLKENDKNGEV